MAGVAIDSILDMRILFDGIPLDKMSVSMTMNGAVLPILALYIVAAEEQGVEPEQLAGTIQNDILKEFMVRNTYIYPPEPSMRIIADIFAYTAQHMPRFNSISISGYHMQEAGATADLELAYTLADGLEYVRTGVDAGLDIDAFAPRLSFFWAIGMNFFMEVAKLRAARCCGPSSSSSSSPRTQESWRCAPTARPRAGASPPRTSTTTWCAPASRRWPRPRAHPVLHTNALDEAIALPTDFSARIARNTQLYLQQETGICQAVDPWGGSYYVETPDPRAGAARGSTSRRSRSSAAWPRRSRPGCPSCASRRPPPAPRPASTPASRRSSASTSTASTRTSIEVLKVDNTPCARPRSRGSKSSAPSATRRRAAALEALTEAPRRRGQPARARRRGRAGRATVGEISDAWRRSSGATRRRSGDLAACISGGGRSTSVDARARATRRVRAKRGPAPAHPGRQDGPGRPRPRAEGDRHRLRRPGLRRRHRAAVPDPGGDRAQAVENDVHVVGVSSLAAGHLTLVPQLSRRSRARREDILVVVGGVIPPQDYDALRDAGAAAIFGPGTVIPMRRRS